MLLVPRAYNRHRPRQSVIIPASSSFQTPVYQIWYPVVETLEPPQVARRLSASQRSNSRLTQLHPAHATSSPSPHNCHPHIFPRCHAIYQLFPLPDTPSIEPCSWDRHLEFLPRLKLSGAVIRPTMQLRCTPARKTMMSLAQGTAVRLHGRITVDVHVMYKSHSVASRAIDSPSLAF